MDSDQQVEAVEPSGTQAPSGVGATLKAARARTGKELPEVALLLRIRQPFLSALEDGRHKDLPGVTYAVGFLRTYADFLNLDGEEMVRRFRQEAAGELNARNELVFPSPVTEGRIPGGAVLFLGLFLGAIAYGGWYWLSSSEGSVAELVPALPDRLAGMLNRPANLTSEKAAAPSADDKLAAGNTATPDTPQGEGGRNVAAGNEPMPEIVSPEPEVLPAEPAPVAEVPEEDLPAAPAAAVEAAVAQNPPPADPKVIGAENVNSRIQIKAVGDECWIQIRELDGQMLQSRLLRDGDLYLVPNRPGLTLMVGNAGALEIRVDGKVIPPLGNPGQVRRDIKLDVESLLAR